MVRTAGTAIKTIGGKSSKSIAVSGGSPSGGRSTRRSIGGNKLVQRAVPQWQKPIAKFFKSDKIGPVEMNLTSESDTEMSVGLDPISSNHTCDGDTSNESHKLAILDECGDDKSTSNGGEKECASNYYNDEYEHRAELIAEVVVKEEKLEN